MKFSITQWFKVTAIGLAILFGAVSSAAHPSTNTAQKVEPSSFSGKYEGTVKDETGEQNVKLDLLEESGKFSGTFTTARGSFKIIKGQVVDGSLTLEIERPGGSAGTMSLRRQGNGLIATASEAGKNLTWEFRKVVVDEISGEWDAVADAQGEAFPFTLTLKLDGERVAGSSSSQLGTSQVSTGIWKDGRLSVVLDSATGPIGLLATLTDGKLVGDYDYAGQLQGKWVAVKKK